MVATYKVILKDGDGDTIWTADNVPGTSEEAAALTSAIPSTPVISKVADYTVLASDLGRIINCNPSGGAFTITLLSAVTATDGERITIRHIGSADQVKIATVSSQTISRSGDTATTAFSLIGYGESATLVADGGNWHLTSYVPPLITATTGLIKIKDRINSAPSPDPGDRYIVTGAFSTFEEGDIIEYSGTGSVYIEYSPAIDCGWLAYVQDEDAIYQYQGTAWTQIIPIPDATDAIKGRIELANATEIAAASDTTRALVAGLLHHHPLVPKAWAVIDATGAIVERSGASTPTSVEDSTGDITVTWGVTFSTSTYAAFAMPVETGGSGRVIMITAQTTTTTSFKSNNLAGTDADPTRWIVVAFGRLA